MAENEPFLRHMSQKSIKTPQNTHFSVFHERVEPHHRILHKILIHFDVSNL